MINNFQDFQKVSKIEMNGYMQAMGEWNKSWQAIASEMTDYTKRSFEDGVATLQKIASAKSVPEALEIQTSFAKRAREDYMQQAAKIGAMYQDLANDSFKPIQRIMRGSL
jgi:phasin family protein